jgi:hypothetical protein
MIGFLSSSQLDLGAWGMLLIIVATGCGGSSQSLTDSQLQKLDPALQRLVQGESHGMDRYSTSKREDGKTAYSVILRSNEPEALRKAGLPLNSVQGDIITARLTIAQIRKAARLEAVRKIENPTQTRPTSRP